MPITIDGKVFKSFAGAVKYVKKKKKLNQERAQAYVATVERKQKGK